MRSAELFWNFCSSVIRHFPTKHTERGQGVGHPDKGLKLAFTLSQQKTYKWSAPFSVISRNIIRGFFVNKLSACLG